MRIFEYLFMQRAFVVGILLAAVVPCVGMVVVCKRLSMIGDALSHTSLAGVAAGLLLGVNPEMSISIIMSAGIGLAGVLSGFVKNSANFNSFLFGSIVAISDAEMISVIVVSVVVLVLFLLLYKELFYISLDERSARLAGVPVGIVNFIFTIMIAVTVSVAARTVGALMVSSMMVVPVACAMQLGKNFKQTVWYAVGLNVLFMIIGLFAAFYLGLKPGGTIVLVGVAALLIIFIGKRIVFGKQE